MGRSRTNFYKVMTLCLSALLLSGVFSLMNNQKTQETPKAGITLRGKKKILSRKKGIWVFVGEKGRTLELALKHEENTQGSDEVKKRKEVKREIR